EYYYNTVLLTHILVISASTHRKRRILRHVVLKSNHPPCIEQVYLQIRDLFYRARSSIPDPYIQTGLTHLFHNTSKAAELFEFPGNTLVPNTEILKGHLLFLLLLRIFRQSYTITVQIRNGATTDYYPFSCWADSAGSSFPPFIGTPMSENQPYMTNTRPDRLCARELIIKQIEVKS
ncbi:MAG TPA: hypothetical protein PL126_06560, partial [Candidatus Cloacimonadota bacterium]|nr:hypothetical protein [Candidatus Cloacimonadota bacterium]